LKLETEYNAIVLTKTMPNLKQTTPNDVRIDKWLWAARFFKTRSLAAAAVKGGKVRVNGSRAKSSRLVKGGDQLHIQRGDFSFDITINRRKTCFSEAGPTALYRITGKHPAS